MTEGDRAPCPACAESIALEARICPHCRSGVLVDLSLSRRLPESRERFQAARSLAALAPAFGGFTSVQAHLAAGGRIATGLTRAQARAAEELLAPPGYREFHFKVNVAGKEACKLTADVTEWKPRDDKPAHGGGSGIEARAVDWLDRLGFDVKLYEGETALMMTQCGSVFGRGTELEEADPRAARVPLG